MIAPAGRVGMLARRGAAGRVRGLALSGAVFLVLAGCRAEAPPYRFVPVDARIATTVAAHADTLVFEVHDPKGIGAASFRDALAPEIRCVRLRLHLKGLESLRFTYGDTVVAVSVPSTAGAGVREELQAPAGASRSLGPDDAGWMPVRLVGGGAAPATIPLQSGWIEVDASRSWLRWGRGPFRIEWVDFYR